MNWEYYDAKIQETLAELAALQQTRKGERTRAADKVEMLYLLKSRQVEHLKDAAEALNITYATVYRWWADYLKHGI